MEKLGGVFVNFVALVLVFLFICSVSVPVRAEEAFLSRSCQEYSSSQEFVKKAVVGCLKAANSRRCERNAQKFFEQCGYEGDFSELSTKVASDLLTVIVLHGTPSLKAPAERKRL